MAVKGRDVVKPPPPNARVPAEKWVEYFAGLKAGRSREESAKYAGISRATMLRIHADPRASSGWEFYKKWLADSVTDVTPYTQLNTAAKRAWNDFEAFRRRYFGHISMPWHVQAGNKIIELLATPQKEFLIINCPPGSGKSTLMTHDIPVWAVTRDRTLRCMIGTGAESTGADYLRRIKTTLERTIPVEAAPDDEVLGLACDARSTLVADYGRYRPEGASYWSQDKLVVAQRGGVPAHQKEASFAAYGRGSQFLGGRFNLVIWDDVVTDTNSRTPAQQAELARWWRTTAESRLEPGGLLVLMGQRMSAHDLYRHALDIKDITAVLDLEEDDIDMEKLPRKYHHVVFKAHYDEKCAGGGTKGPGHDPLKAKPWPDGCLLDPVRLTYRDLMVAKHTDARSYACVYQQEDTDPGSVLVDPQWINGGIDPINGTMYPGCWDKDRACGQFPDNLAGDCWTVATADPSVANFWGCFLWVYQGATKYMHLVDIRRKRMEAPELLDWNHANQRFTGLLEEWWQMSNDVGRPLTHAIVEVNAAQRFLLQYEHAKRWSSLRGVDIVGHYTGAQNKSDPKLGVGALAPEYRHGRVRLPGAPLTRTQIVPLYNEVTRYPDSATTDCTMAQWFLLWNTARLFPERPSEPYRFNRPSWLRGVHRGMGVGA